MMNGTISIDVEYSYFQRKVLEITGIDLSSYKSEQMKRRLNTIMTRCGARNLFEYTRLISQDETRKQEFKDFVTINVSEFFRIPDKFEYLRKCVVPDLLEGRRRLNVWSAGCSDGCEPYSLAIMLHEVCPLGQWRILATDIDATVLERARRGLYPESQLRNVRGDQLQKYFVPLGREFRLADQVKKRIEFKIHDLLRDPYEDDLDLIVCRHVLIYFTEDAKDEIFRRFNSSLRTGGVLFVGGTEMIKMPKSMGYDSPSVSFYQRIGSEPPKVGAVSRSLTQR
ncbi:MAG: protein-glutamate O-methyltransferase CheR [Dehalococcoidia bacterium]|nr:protein-glutamate O-methyltransferase CheR [Dehalococcoidia bacterium]